MPLTSNTAQKALGPTRRLTWEAAKAAKMALDASNTAQGPTEAPRARQEDPPKRAPRSKHPSSPLFRQLYSFTLSPFRASDAPRRLRGPQSAPRRPERPPRGSQDSLGGPQNGRKGAQDRHNGSLRKVPRGPREVPERPPNSFKEASKLPPTGPRDASYEKCAYEHPICLRCPLEQSPPSMLDWHGGGTCRGQLDKTIFRYRFELPGSKASWTVFALVKLPGAPSSPWLDPL